jgi:hypothetical protein
VRPVGQLGLVMSQSDRDCLTDSQSAYWPKPLPATAGADELDSAYRMRTTTGGKCCWMCTSQRQRERDGGGESAASVPSLYVSECAIGRLHDSQSLFSARYPFYAQRTPRCSLVPSLTRTATPLRTRLTALPAPTHQITTPPTSHLPPRRPPLGHPPLPVPAPGHKPRLAPPAPPVSK